MRYTQGQIRDLLAIPVETFRTWRDALPVLAQHRGHGPTFAPGDVVAMAVIAEVVRGYGVRIGTVSERLNKVVEACHGLSWLTLESCYVVIDTDTASVSSADAIRLREIGATALVIPCAPIVKRLRGSLIAAEVDGAQGHLQFPPSVVASGLGRS
ncbi:hypothetical protein NKH89_12255 [Mesorhizobium sp. M0923]|uniref:hypothetical protein n=1 Tax=unclassified Mesorhizobium TaxID=325217 RepID=UPI0003CF9FBF|nr:hypothetical protein [Mesorhizobium sp. L48C026A00]ESZ11302.1 hypothetical protein X737_30010 [Mesorhizobium sp. L48C026A00]